MVSFLPAHEKDPEYYLPDYHGKVFTLSEIRSIVESNGLPGEKWGSIGAGIFPGLVWAVWHFIPLIQAHRSVEWIAWWSLDTLSLRMIMTWLYIHSGKSVFAAAVFHALINLSWQLFPTNGSYYDPQVFGLITLCFAIAIYTVQWFLSAGKLHAV